MNVEDVFDNFQFDNHRILHHQVDLVSTLNLNPVINNRNPDLASYLKPSFDEFVDQTPFINAFQQARPESGMHLHSRVNNNAGDLIDFQRMHPVR